jgi:hypothetical protein
MTRRGTCHIGGLQRLKEIWGIANDMVIAHIGVITAYIGTLHRNAVTPWRTRSIATCLDYSILHNIHAMYRSKVIALCAHDGAQARTRTCIKDGTRLLDISPRTKKHTVGAYLHGRKLIVYLKLLKSKHLCDREVSTYKGS